VVQFKRGDFSTCDAPRPGRPKTVTTPEIIEQIHELILEDRRISAKSITEQLSISLERVGSNIREDLDMRKLSAKWVPKCLNADEIRQRCQACEQLLEFFRRDSNDILSQLVTMDETGYITMTRRQSNNPWSDGIAAHPAPKIPSAKIRWKISRLDFWDHDSILIDHIPKGQTISAEYYSSLLVQLKDF